VGEADGGARMPYRRLSHPGGQWRGTDGDQREGDVNLGPSSALFRTTPASSCFPCNSYRETPSLQIPQSVRKCL
jgi:hypothetical protein